VRRRTHSLALIALLVAGACSSGSSTAKSTAPREVNDGGTFDATGQARVDVTASDFRFSPSTIDGTPGEVLTLVVHNGSGTEHNLTQKAQHVDVDLAGGSTKTVTLTVPSGGRLFFVCEYHSSRGMAGSVGTAGAALPSAGSSPSSNDAGPNPY
jgi:plastocyanin